MTDFQKQILEGIPAELPEKKPYDMAINHAPKRKDILTDEEKVLAVRNALRYFPTSSIAFWQRSLRRSCMTTAASTCTVSVLITRCMQGRSTSTRRKAVRLLR